MNRCHEQIKWLHFGRNWNRNKGGGPWTGCDPAQSPPRCTKCNSPLINGQCANFVLFDVWHYNYLCTLKG